MRRLPSAPSAPCARHHEAGPPQLLRMPPARMAQNLPRFRQESGGLQDGQWLPRPGCLEVIKGLAC